MGTPNRSRNYSDREKWSKILDATVKLLRTQKLQLETLLNDRKLLGDHIYQMKSNLEEKDMMLVFKAARFDLELGLKERDASLQKLKLEQTEDELADFRNWFDYLPSNQQRNDVEIDYANERSRGSRSSSKGSKSVEAELKRMKLEYKKLASEKNSEISTLIEEKNFVWNQYNMLEKNLSDRLKHKQMELDKANERIAEALAIQESLQASINEKDETICKLKSKVDKMEADRSKIKEEMSKMSREMQLIRKSQTPQSTPILQIYNSKVKGLEAKSKLGNEGSSVVRRHLSPANTSVSLKGPAKDSRSSKRKVDDIYPEPEFPKLFSSSFKLPKLKVPIQYF